MVTSIVNSPRRRPQLVACDGDAAPAKYIPSGWYNFVAFLDHPGGTIVLRFWTIRMVQLCCVFVRVLFRFFAKDYQANDARPHTL